MEDAKLGLWGNADLVDAIRHYNGSQYYQSLPDNVRFVHSIAKILAIRNAKDKDALCSAPSLYILGTAPESIGTVVPKREPAFSLGGVEVSGKIWFGSTVMNSSRGVPIPAGADTDALFTYISKTLFSGNRPTIYFDGSISEAILRFYPNGVDAPDDCEDITFSGTHINEATLKGVLDKIHMSIITPTASKASSKLWNDGSRGYPVERAESAIQSIVEIALAPALGNVRVKREETGVYGRYDLALIEQDPLDPSKITNHAILELKVVKTFTSSGEKISDAINKKGILKGVKQAFAYRKEHGSRISAICCYDMRHNPTLHEKSGCKCKAVTAWNVNFWAWPLFSTTEAARDWLASNHLAGN